MSSSSSIAAARRRRAGGASAPTPAPGAQRNSSQASSQSAQSAQNVVNPLVLIQQHHIKISMLEQMVNEISLKQNANNVASTNTVTSSAEKSSNPNLNVNELSSTLINRIEEQLDLKAFYDNDERLMNEIEELKTVIKSQQMVINGLNNTLYTILGKLNLTPLDETQTIDNTIALPKSVIIDEAKNSIKEFIETTLDENDNVNHIYDANNTITFEGNLQA